MTDRRDEGYSVRPVRIGGSGSGGGPHRGRWIGIAVVLAISTGIIGVGWIGPRLNARPNLDISYFATPTPDPNASLAPTPTPSFTRPFPLVTPLPAVTRNGSTILQGRLGVWTDSFHVVDLESGTMTGGVTGQFGNDAFVPALTGDGWTCVCMGDQVSTDRHDREIDVVNLRADGSEAGRRRVETFTGDYITDRTYGVQTDVAVAPDGRTALVVASQREGSTWSYVATTIDLTGRQANGRIGDAVPLGRQEAPIPSPSALPSVASDGSAVQVQTDVYGPLVRRSPDGRHAFVWTTLQQYTQDTQLLTEVEGWVLDLAADGTVSASHPAPDVAALAPYCSGQGFVDDDTFAAICPINDPSGSQPTWRAEVFGVDGRRAGGFELPATNNWYTEPVFDRANRIVWLWDPTGLTLHRIELDTRRVTTQQYTTLVDEEAGDGARPARPPVFARLNSSLFDDVSWDMAGAPDGSRLYLVGYDAAKSNDRGNQASAGIFVVDPGTLALLARWDPDAQYFAVQPIEDGSIVVAAGAPAVDADGNEVPWQASLTFHDATDGRILLRLGQMGDGAYPQIIHR